MRHTFILGFTLMVASCSPVTTESTHSQKLTHLSVLFDKHFGGNYYKTSTALDFAKTIENQNIATKITQDVNGPKIIKAYGCMTYTYDKPHDLEFVLSSIKQIYKLPNDFSVQLQNGLQLFEGQHLQDFNMETNSNAARGVARTQYKKPIYCNPLQGFQHTTTTFYKNLSGVDSNKNGVRDDVEEIIKRDVNSPGARRAVMVFARAVQKQLEYDYRIQDNYRKLAKELNDSRSCIINNYSADIDSIFESKYVNGNDKLGSGFAQQYLDIITQSTINSKARSEAYALHQFAALKTPLQPQHNSGCVTLSDTDPLR